MADKFTSNRERVSEQFESLKNNHREVLNWWQRELTKIEYAYQGVSVLLHRMVSDYDKLSREVKELKDIHERIDDVSATVGKLETDLLAVSERLERIAEWANKQKGIEK